MPYVQLPLFGPPPDYKPAEGSATWRGRSSSVKPEAADVGVRSSSSPLLMFRIPFRNMSTCSKSSSVSIRALLRRRDLRRSVFRKSLANATRLALASFCESFSRRICSLRVSLSSTSSTRFTAADAFGFGLCLGVPLAFAFGAVTTAEGSSTTRSAISIGVAAAVCPPAAGSAASGCSNSLPRSSSDMAH